jgi:hypothetical protein
LLCKSSNSQSGKLSGRQQADSAIGGWTARQIHETVTTTFQLSPKQYGLNQLRYDLRKLKGHGLLERDGRRYAYRLTAKGRRAPVPVRPQELLRPPRQQQIPLQT